jgi:hypothetical protein
MNQRSIVVFLYLKGFSIKVKVKVKAKAKAKAKVKARDVHIELVQVFGSGAIPYSTVTKYIRNDVILQNE